MFYEWKPEQLKSVSEGDKIEFVHRENSKTMKVLGTIVGKPFDILGSTVFRIDANGKIRIIGAHNCDPFTLEKT